jgi:ABC-type transport system involved in multi-copper enzyme maturation permease subunit
MLSTPDHLTLLDPPVLPARRPQAGSSIIVRHELLRLLGDFRFRACSLLIVALLGIAAVVASTRSGSEFRAQETLFRDYRARIADVTVDEAAEILHPAVKPPWRLKLLVDGGQTQTPDVSSQALSALVSPVLGQTHGGNDRLPVPQPLDWMFVISLVLSMSAFLLGYDAVSGERQDGTLRQLLSYPVARWKVLAGKLLAVWICLAAPFLAGALLSLLIGALWGGLRWSGGDAAKIGLVLLLGLWAALFFTLAALLVSSLTRDPATSLGVLALSWVTAVVVIPALGGLLAHRLAPIPAESEINQRIAAIRAQVHGEYGGRESRWRGLEWATADDFALERISARAENRRYALEDAARRWVLERKLGQAHLAHTLAAVSPASLLQDLAERLTGSGLWRDRSFLEQARGFREPLAAWLRGLDARDPRSPHILFFTGYLSRRPIDPATVPRFAFREVHVREGLAAARPALALLAGETLVLAAAAFYFFFRYEP